MLVCACSFSLIFFYSIVCSLVLRTLGDTWHIKWCFPQQWFCLIKTPTKYTFLNGSVSGACAGINVPHPSKKYGGVTPPPWKGYTKSKLVFHAFSFFFSLQISNLL